jgi:uncharacterized membrane protein YfcA
MHIDPSVAVAGLIVGFTVGLTGMGGGALMTPILVLLFRVQPLAAVSSDLVASFFMKPVGSAVHLRRGTVNRDLVKWLVVGSVPCAFGGVFLLRALGAGPHVQNEIKIALGAALVLACGSIVAKALLQLRASNGNSKTFVVRPAATVAIGALGGLIVGMTSVGSGSLIIVMLLVLYPSLTAKELVGTDLLQAVPLVGAASLGHVLFGDFKLGLTASLLIGSIPGVYIGARVSSRAPDHVIRPALVVVLLASALKLFNVSTPLTGIMVLSVVLLALPVWGAIDAARRPAEHFADARLSRKLWVGAQAASAPLAVGFPLAVAYFAMARRRLAAVEALDGARSQLAPVA